MSKRIFARQAFDKQVFRHTLNIGRYRGLINKLLLCGAVSMTGGISSLSLFRLMRWMRPD